LHGSFREASEKMANREPLHRLQKLLTVQPGVLSASRILQYANSAIHYTRAAHGPREEGRGCQCEGTSKEVADEKRAVICAYTECRLKEWSNSF
jgi:hypothetical protein